RRSSKLVAMEFDSVVRSTKHLEKQTAEVIKKRNHEKSNAQINQQHEPY
ncbi:unnamed protein product, partial [Heterotrigona itama]